MISERRLPREREVRDYSAMNDPTDRPNDVMTLAQALREICSRDVLTQLLQAEQLFTRTELRDLEKPEALKAMNDEHARYLSPSQRLERHGLLNRAWAAIQHDVQMRLESEECFMTGVPRRPMGTTDRVLIPGVWATRFKFDFFRNVVWGIVGSYDAVRIHLQHPDTPRTGAFERVTIDRPTEQPASTNELSAEQELEAGPQASGSRRRGRPPFPIDDFVKIARHRLHTRHTANKAEANALREAFPRQNVGKQVPAFTTIEDHVQRIYEQAAREEASEKL